jgi:hypothetical protein
MQAAEKRNSEAICPFFPTTDTGISQIACSEHPAAARLVTQAVAALAAFLISQNRGESRTWAFAGESASDLGFQCWNVMGVICC